VRAYAICMTGLYFLVNAPDAAQAKGAVIRLAYAANVRQYRGLRCRRWPEFDGGDARVMEWGYPGARDPETGVRIEIPSPFAAVAP
jgi:hypothetical protein